jgi:hypothetical protein
MQLSRLLTALALPAVLTATACAADPYNPINPAAPPMSDTQAASLWLRRNPQPIYVPQQQICAPYPSVTVPGMQPGQAPVQPGQTPGTPPSMAPVQTPEAAAAAPQTSAFSQAPSAGGSAGYSFAPNMIGDLGVGGSFARGTITVPGLVARPSTGNGGVVFVPGTVVRTNVPIPATGRGAFKIDENESPRPVDRFFINYNYFNGIGSGVPGLPIFDLHRQTFGFEKTFLDGDASIGLRVNTLQSTGDGSLGGNDFGDMTIVTKFALINDQPNGNVVSVGMAVTVPTGPDLILNDGSRLNPVLLQPWTGFIYVMDRLFAQGFSSLVIPLDNRDVLLSTGSIAVGYQLYQAACPANSCISYITPVIEGHTTIPLNHRGIDSTPTGFPDLFVLTNGVHIGLGQRTNLTLGVAVPLTGPKLFDIEALALLNFRF